MSKLLGAYNMSGSLDGDLLYTTLFDEIPCKYIVCVEDESKQLETKEITIDKCKHLFDDILTFRQYTEIYEESNDKDESEFVDPSPVLLDDVFASNNRAGALWVVEKRQRIFIVTFQKCSVLYSPNDNLDEIKSFVTKLWNCFPKAEPEDKTSKVGLIKYSQQEYYTSFSDIRNTTINIGENYNDDFIPVYNDVVNFLNQKESGLILLYGKCGTGKTHIIRHLCSNIPKDYVIVPNSVASRLGDPDLISYISSCKNYVFILEDCEQLLVDRIDNPWNNAITTILNMADGLLSDIVNIKFICTFNAAVEKIDPALLRKGRCFAKYEFKELCEEKVKILNEKYNLGIEEIKPMTLAEVYNAEKRNYSEDVKPKMHKIGF